MSFSNCSLMSWCKFDESDHGHHKRCKCGFRFNCFSGPIQYCDTPDTCTKCCLEQNHHTKKCSGCGRDVPVSCRGICFEMSNDVCRDCQCCSICETPYYKTKAGYQEQNSICGDCWEKSKQRVKCSRRKCKRYVVVHDTADHYCGHPMCK